VQVGLGYEVEALGGQVVCVFEAPDTCAALPDLARDGKPAAE